MARPPSETCNMDEIKDKFIGGETSTKMAFDELCSMVGAILVRIFVRNKPKAVI